MLNVRLAALGLAVALGLSSLGLSSAGLWNAASAQEKKEPKKEPKKQAPAVTDIKQADADFALQGEYLGQIKVGDQSHKFGAQVIALSNGKFQVCGYPGGLPGAGWDGKHIEKAEGTLENGAVTFSCEKGTGTLQNGKLTVLAKDGGQVVGTAERVLRESPTLGAAPPSGAIVLFDGKSADNFTNGKLTDDGLLNVGVKTKQAFQDFTLHMEFRLPYMPAARGQGRANSGLYLQDRYECQILDSFGLAGLDNECGGFYQQRKPDVNMCFPPLSWQTYDIDFTAARFDEAGKRTAPAKVTVRHNGVVIHENFEFPKSTAGGQPETAAPGVLQLQQHGNPVHFRNIWIVERSKQ